MYKSSAQEVKPVTSFSDVPPIESLHKERRHNKQKLESRVVLCSSCEYVQHWRVPK